MLVFSSIGKVVDLGLAIGAVAVTQTAVSQVAALRSPTIYTRNYLTALQYGVYLLLAFNLLSLVSAVWSLVRTIRSRSRKADEEAPANQDEEVLRNGSLRLFSV